MRTSLFTIGHRSPEVPNLGGSTVFCGIGLLWALMFWTGPAFGQGAGATVSTTFTESRPEPFGYFGSSVAAGGERVLIGAAEAAYLFSASGTLLTSFAAPSPGEHDAFGVSVALVGDDLVLIGANGDDTAGFLAGAAYLFSADGTLLKTFTHPDPASEDYFGSAVTAVGKDRVLIGAPADNAGAVQSGSAHLFSIDGTLITTFTSPTPSVAANFGVSLAVVGADHLLIGARSDSTTGRASGAAWLFHTNGTLVTTFRNPSPGIEDNFGSVVAAVGSDMVVITAPRDDTTELDAGAAYLFRTNGELVTTFSKPSATTVRGFGASASALGHDRVFIGAPFERGDPYSSGAGWVFSTSGTLIATIPNPAPTAHGRFGLSAAPMGNDQILIGAPGNSAGMAEFAGTAYLFTLGLPALTITQTSAEVIVSWPSPSTGFALQQNSGLSTSDWILASQPITDNGTWRSITVSPPLGSRFYRLFKQ